ncbi:class I SAM-dependent methyltransferase [Bosea sp. BK604]|uniref:class I SAM-dependent methyltransferase n=1 Tax=Bosea sp. BK604 TaxID=2512180 RepID=UPI00104C1BA5|nr:class I SAM-dependent methyltransferase [Bosea sp. BK604]TCR63139.1 methyltransferase family protein [Bosea sp. BK604]
METAQLRYNWTDADIYEAFMGRWSEYLAGPFLARADLAPGARVLDLACGTGVLSKALAEAGAQVVGVDASEGYLEGARLRRPHPHVSYEQGDARHLRFDDNAFDAAVSTLALDVIPEVEQVVAEMKRVTRPGGVVASAVTQFFGGMPAFDLVYNTGAVLESAAARMRSARAGRTQFWPGGQAALWRKLGLAEVTEIPVVVDCEYRSFQDYWVTFTDGPGSVTAMLMGLSSGARAAIEQHVRAGYLVGLPDGPRSFPMIFRVVRGLVPA